MDLKDDDMILPNQDELSNEDVVSFYNSFENLVNRFNNKSTFNANLSKMISSGEKVIYNKTVTETKEYETTFLDTLEAALPAFTKIAKDPKSSIKYEEDIVRVEKARKISAESIRHLASHSQNVREIKGDNVIPSKILTNFADEDLAIYENRLYKTLVNNIVRFLTRREQLLSENLESSRVDEINYTNNLKFDESNQIDIALSIRVKKALDDEIAISREILKRTQDLLLAYKGLKSTPFLKGLQNAKDVFPPIMKTNIILHNPEFKIVYNTWVFMERYSSLSFDVNVKDDDYNKDTSIESDLNNISLALFNTLLYHRNNSVEIERSNDLIKNTNVSFNKMRNTDFDIKPGNVDVDDYTYSELFLSKASQYFEDDYKESLENDVTREVSLKNAVCKMLQIINQIGPAVFKYKDNDLDEIGKSKEDLVREAEERYEALKIYREEKELDLEKNRDAEEKALEHLNKLKNELELEQHEIELKLNKLDAKALQEELEKQHELDKERELHQEELRKQNDEKLRELALEKELRIISLGYHSRKRKPKTKRIRVRLRHYDLFEDSRLNLFADYSDIVLKGRRDYLNSNRLSLNDVLDKLYYEKLYKMAKAKAEEDIFLKAFKFRHRDKKKNRVRNKLIIKNKRQRRGATKLDLFAEPVHFKFLVPLRFDLHDLSERYREPELIVLTPKTKKKFVGIKKTVVKKKVLEKDEIKQLNKKKVIGSKKKLVNKKTITK